MFETGHFLTVGDADYGGKDIIRGLLRPGN